MGGQYQSQTFEMTYTQISGHSCFCCCEHKILWKHVEKCNHFTDIPHTLHSTGNSVYLPWHCGQKYPPRDKPGPLLLSRWLGDTQWGKPLWYTHLLLTHCLLLTPYWTKAWCPGRWQRRWCAEGILSRHKNPGLMQSWNQVWSVCTYIWYRKS